MNAVIGAGAAPPDDWLLVCLAPEATTLAILRGEQLMFYRHRTAVDEEPLSALVHQTAMYHEDRLGGDAVRARLAVRRGARGRRRAARPARDCAIAWACRPKPSTCDRRRRCASRCTPPPDVLDALAAPVGVLLRERQAA